MANVCYYWWVWTWGFMQCLMNLYIICSNVEIQWREVQKRWPLFLHHLSSLWNKWKMRCDCHMRVFTILYRVILLTNCRHMNVSKAFMQVGCCICAHSHSEEEITTVLVQQVLFCLLDFFWVSKISILKRRMLSVWIISTSRRHVFYVFLCLRACLLEKADQKGYTSINMKCRMLSS